MSEIYLLLAAMMISLLLMSFAVHCLNRTIALYSEELRKTRADVDALMRRDLDVLTRRGH